MPLNSFHPALKTWFEQNLGQPTPAQAEAWPAIQQGKHTLIAAPTGSGKTLAAFYAVINELVQLDLKGALPQKTQVVYISPLKALSNDIHRNLEVPLAGIQEELGRQGFLSSKISVAVRTGDTSNAERQKILKKPPHILVTTPESLYLLLTSVGGRKMLENVRTLIIDEIHALLGDKRGSHLALSVERLEAIVKKPLRRIGLSATQKPIDLVAKYLVGGKNIQNGKADCAMVDAGYRRKLDISIEIPRSPLTAVMSNEVWTELYERLVELISQHQTTLVFVNTRRLAERLARGLAERIGEEHVSSHHGSMSKEHRHKAEKRLKAGQLKVLVATASMELGIDIGSVNLVVQFSSPKRIAAFLQRVGRSGHYVGGTPKGILFPLSRDDLMEAVALFDSIRRGELDQIVMPEGPLDILSQQIVAEVSGREWKTGELFQLCKNAYPFRNLTQEKFRDVLHMLSEGYTTRRGRRGAYLHYDAIHKKIRARAGARLSALTNGGAIPDMFDYEVVLQPEGITVGTLNEDFALESLAGDIFTLGTHSWQLVRIEGLKVMVHDAAGKPPSVPFWLGESFARSSELSFAVSRLRETIDAFFEEEPLSEMNTSGHMAVKWLTEEVKIAPEAAEQLVMYLWMGRTGLGVMPTQSNIVMERFFDEAGDMHLVVHSPYGSRMNRGWGLALRKKFCRKFNFELQAAADENSMIFSLSSSHSFPVEDVGHYLKSKTARDTLTQAILDTPFFEIRWRWNATRSLAILRNRAGKRVPPHFQRLQAEDLIAQVFPGQIACAENIVGDVEIPKHPLVDQVLEDCLTEAADIHALEKLLQDIEAGKVKIIAKDLREPSMFAQEIINARPYAFLDDTEFAQRRVNAIQNRGWLDPAEAKDLSKLDPQAIVKVKEEAWPSAQNADELHDILMIHGFIKEEEGIKHNWVSFFEDLIKQDRALRLEILNGNQKLIQWIAMERGPMLKLVYPQAEANPPLQKVPGLKEEIHERNDALREIVRGRLEALGPVTELQLVADTFLPQADIEQALLALENEGFVFQGNFTPRSETREWCERRLLQRIHRYTLETLRQSIQPVSIQNYMRFLLHRHQLDAETPPSGPQSLQGALEILEGFEAPASAWERDLLPSRISPYDPLWLDGLSASGRFAWGRFILPKKETAGGPVKNTPINIVLRAHIPLWQKVLGAEAAALKVDGAAGKIFHYLEEKGASFFADIEAGTGLLESQVKEGIAELVNMGKVTSDSFAGLRSLLIKRTGHARRKRRALFGIEHAGRWSLMPNLKETIQPDSASNASYEVLEELVFIYLKRWGVLFRSILEKESSAPPWRLIVRVLRRLELQGELRGGRFVSQVSGEQFGMPETIDHLRQISRKPETGQLISISAADPLNLTGFLLPGKKVAKLAKNRVLLKDGLPAAYLEGGKAYFLHELSSAEEWKYKKALIQGRKEVAPKEVAPI